jgi:hypothetical protein
MALTQTSRNLFDRITAIENAVLGDGLLCIDKANDVYIKTGSGAPSDGVLTGTGAGVTGPGSLYIDYASGKQYTNTGTKAAPYWLCIGNESS